MPKCDLHTFWDSVKNGTLGYRPTAFSCSTPCIGVFLVYSQAKQVFLLSLWFLPKVPDAVPQTVAYPSIQVFEFAVDTCHSEISQPTPLEFFKPLDSFIEGTWSGLSCDNFDFLL